MKTPRGFQRKKGATTVVSGHSVKCNAIFAVYDLSALGFETVGIRFYPPKPHRSRGTEIDFWTPCDMLY